MSSGPFETFPSIAEYAVWCKLTFCRPYKPLQLGMLHDFLLNFNSSYNDDCQPCNWHFITLIALMLVECFKSTRIFLLFRSRSSEYWRNDFQCTQIVLINWLQYYFIPDDDWMIFICLLLFSGRYLFCSPVVQIYEDVEWNFRIMNSIWQTYYF